MNTKNLCSILKTFRWATQGFPTFRCIFSRFILIYAKTPHFRAAFLLYIFYQHILVPMVGLEPTRCCHQRILSPSRLPIPSHRRIERLGTVQTSFSLLYNKCAQIARHFCFDFQFTQEGNLLQTILSHSRPNKQIKQETETIFGHHNTNRPQRRGPSHKRRRLQPTTPPPVRTIPEAVLLPAYCISPSAGS